MTLHRPQNEYETVQNYTSKIERNWRGFSLPRPIKNRLIERWRTHSRFTAVDGGGYVRLYTSGENFENVVYCDLAKAIVAHPLNVILRSHREKAIAIAERHRIAGFKDDYKTKNIGLPRCWNALESAIDTDPELSDEEKQSLKTFLTDADSYYGIKGIARDDFANPAICNAIGKRVDRFSIAYQIADATDDDLYHSVTRYIDGLLSHDEVPSSFLNRISGHSPLSQLVQSLLSKPFVILTGASGTGKTKLAESVAACFRNADESNVAKVAVGADWTDNRNVLGFVNHLKEVRGGPCYQSTPVLDLLLRATDHPDMPYFLILDEMNLSHVERYFSDFLSVMEQRDGCFDLHTSGDGQEAKSLLWRDENDLRGVPCQLNWPQNLFVVGTVNIDETTYMFSPKVLDRANVIEFKVDRNAMEGFLDEPTGYPPFENGGDELARGFLQLARQACIDDSDADGLERPGGNAATEIKRHLLALFDILQSGRFEYAFRTANEVLRYLRVCRHLAADRNAWDEKGWQTDLDDQILQKLLPKLHGSVGRVGPLLAGLSHYCHSGVSVGASGINMKTAVDLQCGDGTLFPKSLNKLKSMIRTLQDEQFVSFIQ